MLRSKKPDKPYKIKWHRVDDALRPRGTKLYYMSGVGIVYYMSFPMMPGNDGWFCRIWGRMNEMSSGPINSLKEAKLYLELLATKKDLP